MTDNPGPRIVCLGMLTKIPVAGAIWGMIPYLVGFARLGCDVYYVEAHGRAPSMLMESKDDDGAAKAAALLGSVMARIGFKERWAYQAFHDDGRCYGMSAEKVAELFRTADLIVNHHGGTLPRPEHTATGRLIYLETDPVELEVELHNRVPGVAEFVSAHSKFFTWGLNYGRSDCRVPLPNGFEFHISCPPVNLDDWVQDAALQSGDRFTTVGNWRQAGEVRLDGERYTWSKHHEFLKVLDLPARTGQAFELALSSYQPADQKLLESRGWNVRSALAFSGDLDEYRRFVLGSRGEFTVAKDQNVRLRSGWFSERSAQYLAAGRPVITQDTGFGSVLPTGEGLFSFSSLDEACAAVEEVNSDYERHCRAAREIAREYFSVDVVLPKLLDQAGEVWRAPRAPQGTG